MSKPRATDLLEPLPYFGRLCLCGGCRPSTMLKRTWVCFDCRTTQRKVGWVDLDIRGTGKKEATRVVCQECGEQMTGIPLSYAAAVPRKTNDTAWKLLERSLDRPREKHPYGMDLQRKKFSNRKAKRKGKTYEVKNSLRSKRR